MSTRLLITIMLISFAYSQQFSSIGLAHEAFLSCDILGMSRDIGGPPSKENYWNGSLYLQQYSGLAEARIDLTLDAPAAIKLDPEEGRVLVLNDTFHLSFFKPDAGYQTAHFRVEGRPFGKFPNVKSLVLNDNKEVCPNPRPWKPTILGATNTGQTEFADPQLSPTLPNCGRRFIEHQGLVKGGDSAKEGDWPWHTAIFHRKEESIFAYKCGGTLINSNTVLTAGHCIVENGRFIVPDRVLVRLGLHSRFVAGRHTQEFQVFRVIPHEEYDFIYLHNDIALLKLATEATFTNYVYPACLWSPSETDLSFVIDKPGEVIGWGYFNEANKLSEYLMEGRMPVVSLLSCLESNRDFYGKFVSDRNFCAGHKNGTSVCNGDSGGGMFFQRDGVYKIRGIVSLSVSLDNQQVCNPLEYVVFTDAAQYLDWIAKHK